LSAAAVASPGQLRKLSSFTALSFDCYGTLIDWETGLIEALAPLASRAAVSLSRDEILQAHAYQESTAQAQTPARPYRDILATVYRRLAETWSVPVSWSECEDHGRSIRSWQPFNDTVEALRYLKSHYRLIILSNIDNESFAATNARLEIAFDAVYTAEDVGAYKPSTRGFQYMLERSRDLGLGKEDILHVAESLYHDHSPANALGMTSCLIHRRHDQPGFGATREPDEMPAFAYRFESLAALVDAHRAELADTSQL
jgi:2-haloacid dehalogenase